MHDSRIHMNPIRFSMSDFPQILMSLSLFVSSNIFDSLNDFYKDCNVFYWASNLYIFECFFAIFSKGFFTKIFVLLSTRSNVSFDSLLRFFIGMLFYSFYNSIEFSLSIFRGFIVLLIWDFKIFFNGIR